jgi:predicted CXXCH cytochrome family protein
MKNTRTLFILLFLVVLLSNCSNKSDEYIDPRGTDYAGSESCIQCHQAVYQKAIQSSHYKATSAAIKGNVLGNFSSGDHVFIYDKNTKMVMEERNDSLYQVLYKNGKEVEAHKLEIVFGTKHAQTSVFWRNNNTYELPLSYYTSVHSWATSPGFSAEKPYFDRKVVKDCYACHSSNISSRNVDQNSKDKNFMSMDVEDVINKKTIVYGIDCERCHGPAKEHVNQHLKFPDLKVAKNIVTYKSLTRQQKLDACALCHSGNDGMKIKSRFDFKPGDNLSEYFRSSHCPTDTTDFDVHGNQFKLLSQSKCFTKSETMDCISCHNPHENATKNLATYSKICMSCHNTVKHNAPTVKTISDNLLQDNCIECHMPNKPSGVISFRPSKATKDSNYMLRTHKIAIYPTKKK